MGGAVGIGCCGVLPVGEQLRMGAFRAVFRLEYHQTAFFMPTVNRYSNRSYLSINQLTINCNVMIQKNKSVAFTGHRSNRISMDREVLCSEIEKTVISLYISGYRHFMSGMAEGFDLLAAEVVLKIKKIHPDIKLTAVIPFSGQSFRFSDKDKSRYATVLQQCDDTVLITKQYFAGCFHRRNDYLADNSNVIVSYFDGTSSGGTFYTVSRAKAKNIPIININQIIYI